MPVPSTDTQKLGNQTSSLIDRFQSNIDRGEEQKPAKPREVSRIDQERFKFLESNSDSCDAEDEERLHKPRRFSADRLAFLTKSKIDVVKETKLDVGKLDADKILDFSNSIEAKSERPRREVGNPTQNLEARMQAIRSESGSVSFECESVPQKTTDKEELVGGDPQLGLLERELEEARQEQRAVRTLLGVRGEKASDTNPLIQRISTMLRAESEYARMMTEQAAKAPISQNLPQYLSKVDDIEVNAVSSDIDEGALRQLSMEHSRLKKMAQRPFDPVCSAPPCQSDSNLSEIEKNLLQLAGTEGDPGTVLNVLMSKLSGRTESLEADS